MLYHRAEWYIEVYDISIYIFLYERYGMKQYRQYLYTLLKIKVLHDAIE